MNNFLIPDILLVILPFVVIGSHFLFPKRHTVPFVVGCIGFLGTFVMLNLLVLGETQTFLSNWKIDSFGVFMREVLILGALLGIWFSKDYFEHGADGKEQLHQLPEFIAAISVATFGGVTVVSACDLLTLFLGLELATIPMYALAAWNKSDPGGSEAGTKYILMGSVATAFELFGFSYLYGFSGSMKLTEIAAAVTQNGTSPLLWISVLFLICGIGFKLTLFPFHTWAPDVYEGAPTPVTAVLAVTSKAVAVTFLVVLVFGPFASIHTQLIPFLSILAAVTILAGNLGALKQSRLRRFMAYSSISQAGYILLAILGPEIVAKSAIVYYLVVYTFANYLAFFVFGIIGQHRTEGFDSLRGLSKENPTLAIALAIAAFSLAGIPPLAGFIGKFMLFESAAEAKTYALIAFAVLNNVVALYYYIQLIKGAWVDPPDENLPRLEVNKRQKFAVVVLTLGVLFVGVVPFLSENIRNILAM